MVGGRAGGLPATVLRRSNALCGWSVVPLCHDSTLVLLCTGVLSAEMCRGTGCRCRGAGPDVHMVINFDLYTLNPTVCGVGTHGARSDSVKQHMRP